MKPSIHRPTKLIIDSSAISKNLAQVMAALPAQTKAFAVVKANAYGHGVLEVARELGEQVDGFCVSNMDEALELRLAGFEHPILVLGVVPVQVIPQAIQASISLTVASLEWLSLAQEAGLLMEDLAIHIKVDTGMGRLGFRDCQSLQDALNLMATAGARFEGIFTHFATADQADDSQFREQLAIFQEIVDGLESLPPLIHASNSATSIWHGETVFNMVRLGNILYGLNPSGRELDLPYPIQPALRLTSELVHVKEVAAGTAVGYGATYHSPTKEWLGTVPIGYADGLTRSMQGFSVLVDGQRCEIVGRVSMDQITIRLPHSYPLGTPVTLIGEDGGQEVTVQDWADYRQTINYEVTCLLSDRIPRYYDES